MGWGKYTHLTLDRVRRLPDDLRQLVVEDEAPFDVAAWDVIGEPVSPTEGLSADYAPFTVGEGWGRPWTTTWFRMRGTVPQAWAGRPVVAIIDLAGSAPTGFGGEALVYRDGVACQGLSPNHRFVRLTAAAEGGEDVELHIEAAANPMLTAGDPLLSARADGAGEALYRLERAGLAIVDATAEAASHDARVLVELLSVLPEDEPRHARILVALNDACNTLDGGYPRRSLAAVRAALAPALASPAVPSAHAVTASGHAHIDSAWLWPVRETRRKCARTFSTVLALMEQYPEYRFVCSQPQQYAWVRDDHPELFERIRAAVAAGRWEPVGGMWVEADCNLAGAESLVRQLLLGRRFFQESFGYTPRDVWLPDVFGYAANLPQLFRKAGVDFFLTQKLSWNQFNRIPHTTFWWQGIDGSRVLTHFPPADTYNGSFEASQLVTSVRQHRDHGRSDRSLYLFGFGDGGGGPTTEMLESARRLGDLEGAPRVQMGRVSDFVDSVREDSRDLCTWVGELYLEYHRGTYTTQARTKRGNRRCEILLRDAELISAMTATCDAPTRSTLRRCWEMLLLNQFHDIIPGSSIDWVYEVAEREYAEIAARLGPVIERGLATAAATTDTSWAKHPVVVVNTLSGTRSAQVIAPLPRGMTPSAARYSDGGLAPLQLLDADADGRRTALLLCELPGCGCTVLDLVDDGARADNGGLRVTPRLLENETLRVEFDELGLMSSIYDKEAQREILADGRRGNMLQLHEDRPLRFEAWDLDIFDQETVEDVTALEETTVVEWGPVRVCLRQRRTLGIASSVTQWISLSRGSRVVRVETEIDWREDHRLLKVAFPVSVNSPRATYEVQFGHVERPTHQNTSWDVARFEVCAHRWADLSEAGHGVALLNDCKYGYDIRGNVMRLSLLRAPTFPDPHADRGMHRFTYALMPHRGDLREAGVIAAAYDLNVPVRAVASSAHPGRGAEDMGWLDVDEPGVVIETVKLAEDDDSVIVRLYEAFGGRRRATLSSQRPLMSVTEADLMESDVRTIEVHDQHRVELELGPFDVCSLRLRIASPSESASLNHAQHLRTVRS